MLFEYMAHSYRLKLSQPLLQNKHQDNAKHSRFIACFEQYLHFHRVKVPFPPCFYDNYSNQSVQADLMSFTFDKWETGSSLPVLTRGYRQCRGGSSLVAFERVLVFSRCIPL